MTEFASARIRKIILDGLAERGLGSVGETEALFSTGLLDSLAAAEVLVALETGYGIDLADEDFDILEIDTLAGIEQLVASRQTATSMDHALS
ncbi:phosphopantetheine-binding protein [Rhizobium sp.]